MINDLERERIQRIFETLPDQAKREINRAVDEAVIEALQAAGFAVYDKYGARMIIMYHGIDVSDIVFETIKQKLIEMGRL